MKILDIRKGAFNDLDINELKDAIVYLSNRQYEIIALRFGGIDKFKDKAKARNINFIIKKDAR